MPAVKMNASNGVRSILFVLLLSAAFGKEDVSIAFIQRSGTTCILKMYHAQNETYLILAENISIPYNQVKIVSHSTSGIMCWFAYGKPEAYAKLNCYNQPKRSLTSIVLPIRWPKYDSGYGLDLSIDEYGNNVYWQDPQRTYKVWATSLETNASKLIILSKTLSGPLENNLVTLSNIDSAHGYYFSSLVLWDATCVAPLEYKDKDDEKNYCQYQDPLVNQSTRSKLGGFSIDTKRENVYWLTYEDPYDSQTPNDPFHRIQVAEYPYAASNNRSILYEEYGQVANLPVYNLDYFDDMLYWISSQQNSSDDGQVLSYPSIPCTTPPDGDKTSPKPVFNQSDVVAFTMYEDRSPGQVNPCPSLNCSHLCLPLHHSKTHICACPSGLSLVNQTTCKPMGFLSLTSSSQTYFYYPFSGQDDKYEECQIYLEGTERPPVGSSDLPPTPCTESMTHHLSTLTPLPPFYHFQAYNIQLDPYGNGYLKSIPGSECVEYCTFASKGCVLIFCSDTRMNLFSMDFPQWILFRAQKVKNEPGEGYFIIGTDLPINTEKYRFKLWRFPKSIGVYPATRKIFWMDPALSVLVVANYDGTGQETVNAELISYGPSTLQVGQNRLFWYRSGSSEANDSGLRMFDLDVQASSLLIPTTSQDISKFLLLPPLTLSNPCSAASCSHACAPIPDSGFYCACPEAMILDKDSRTCVDLHVQFGLILRHGEDNDNASFSISTGVTWGALDPLVTETDVKDIPANTIFSVLPTPFVSTVCWATGGSETVHCYGKNVSTLTTVHPNTSILVFDNPGRNVFYNDGYFGNVYAKSLSTGGTFMFKPFLADKSVKAWVLDSHRKVFFWSSKTRTNLTTLQYAVVSNLNLNHATGSITLPELDPVFSMTVDWYSNVLYFVQGHALKSIGYSDVFLEETHPPTVLKTLKQVPVMDLSLQPPYLFWVRGGEENVNDRIFMLNLQNNKERMLWKASSETNISNFFFYHPYDIPDKERYDPCYAATCSDFCFPVSPLSDIIYSDGYECACPPAQTLSGVDKSVCAKIPNSSSNQFIFWLSLSLAIVAGILAVSTLAVIRTRRRNFEIAEIIKEIRDGNPDMMSSASNDADRAQHVPLKCIISPSELDINKSKVLGTGISGIVYQGVYRNKVIAIKTLKSTHNPHLLSEFAKEIKIMHYLGHHPNIVRFYGTDVSNITKGAFYAVMELSPHGSLLEYLRKYSIKSQSHPNSASEIPSSPPTNHDLEPLLPSIDQEEDGEENPGYSINLNNLVDWAEQIARGMAYLAQKLVIHGDLAARNVLVFDGSVVKISDFGFSKRLYQHQQSNYKKNSQAVLPWKWMAIESLQFYDFSTKSDVWSYGVTLWEIFSSGQVPYPEHRWNAKFLKLIKDGKMLDKPDIAPQFLYDHIMKPCWKLDPRERPDFTGILEAFTNLRNSSILSSDVVYEVMDDEYV